MLHSPEEAATDEMWLINNIGRLSCIKNKPPGPAFKIGKKTLITAYISDPIISSNNVTIATESYQEGTEPTQTRYVRESDKFKKKPNSTRGQHRTYCKSSTQRPMFEYEIGFVLHVRLFSVTMSTYFQTKLYPQRIYRQQKVERLRNKTANKNMG